MPESRLNYLGNPNNRTEISFLLEFAANFVKSNDADEKIPISHINMMVLQKAGVKISRRYNASSNLIYEAEYEGFHFEHFCSTTCTHYLKSNIQSSAID